MSAEDHETLSLGLAHGYSLRMMASVLGRTPSTIRRELAPNATRDRPYRAWTVHTFRVTLAGRIRASVRGKGEL